MDAERSSTSTSKTLKPKPKADCAWCGAQFTYIVDLLAHVEEQHLDLDAAA
jgi:hypothetical protein